jgi:hypothetical protein
MLEYCRWWSLKIFLYEPKYYSDVVVSVLKLKTIQLTP